MSKEEDDRRQYQCLMKYEEIVKQVLIMFLAVPVLFRFDVLIEMVDARTRPPKSRRVSSASTSRESAASTATTQSSIDEVLVQTITKFLHELNANFTEP